jgi:hypothetical protein
VPGYSGRLEHGVVDVDEADVVLDLMRHAELDDDPGIDWIL